MSVEQLKKVLSSLSAAEQKEIGAFLFHLRHRADADYQDAVSGRISDKNQSNWLTPKQFEDRLDTTQP